MLVSEQSLFFFTELNKSVNVVVGGVTFTGYDIILFGLPKRNRKPRYKKAKQGSDVLETTQYKDLLI